MAEERVTDMNANAAGLRYLAAQQGLRPDELAKGLGISVQAVNDRTSGRTAWRWPEIKKLRQLLRVDMKPLEEVVL